jgi:nicotinamidase-related amidase
MLYPTEVPIEQSALLVVDVQDSFLLDAKWERRNNKNFEKNVAKLIELYRTAGLPIFYFSHSDADPGFGKTDAGYRLMDFLKPLPNEPVIEKDTRNVFTSTNVSTYLLEKGVRRLAICGIQMEQCCETSARVAADLGYAVDFMIDATLTFPIKNYDNPAEELGVKEIEERTKYALRKRFARITPIEQLESELKGVRKFAHAG